MSLVLHFSSNNAMRVAVVSTRWTLQKNGGLQRVESKLVLSHIFLAVLAFYLGIFLGMAKECPTCDIISCPPCLQPVHQEEMCPPCPKLQMTQQKVENHEHEIQNVNHYMPQTISNVVAGIGRVNREAFAKAFDVGVPVSPSIYGNQDVLILYGKDSLPLELNSSSLSTTSIPLLSSPAAAAKNCLTMKMVLIQPEENTRCVAIMGQWPSYHVHKFMRIKKTAKQGQVANKGRLPNLGSLDNPFRYTGKTQSFYEGIGVPRKYITEQSYSWFTEYMTRMKEASQTLKPIAKTLAKGGNTIIVMLCNQGLLELFINFVCSARSRNLDTSQILLFATDLETKELAEGLGITTFYDENIFGEMPKAAAETYGDPVFSKMMLAKVYCVQLINMLEYNVLFQDVDIVWYRNPLEFLQSKEMEELDFIFQDDGARTTRYQPYSPNTGFYFVRYNERTFYFLSCLIRMGDKIVDRGSHQEALNILLGDHASLYGLRIKVLNRDDDYFPGGFHFHRRPDFMKDHALGKVQPYVFHMSWTENKGNKRFYFEQIGDFHVKDHCIGKTLPEIRNSPSSQDLVASCCMAEGPVICHYRDKPSKIPCNDSPAIDKGKPSFW